MIRVKLELDSHGLGKKVVSLGEARIWNDGTGTRTSGNYKFELTDRAGRVRFKGEVKDFPRLQRLGWDLMYRVLHAAVGLRNALK